MGYDAFFTITGRLTSKDDWDALLNHMVDHFFTEHIWQVGSLGENEDGSFSFSLEFEEARNVDTDEISEELQPYVDSHNLTFEVIYQSDYTDGTETFWVGPDALLEEFRHKLKQRDALNRWLSRYPELIERIQGEG